MNNGTTGTASSGSSGVKPFRAPARASSSPYKAFQKPHSEVVQGSQRKKQKEKTVPLKCLSPAQPISDSELDGLVRGIGRLTLADDRKQGSFTTDDGFNISAAAAPYRSSTLFGPPYSIPASLGGDLSMGMEPTVETETGAPVCGTGPPTRSHHWPDDPLAKSGEVPGTCTPPPERMFCAVGSPPDILGNLVSACSPLPRPIHTTPIRRSSVATVHTTSAIDPPSVSRPCLTTVTVSLVYEVFASPDDEADEVQTWYPIGDGALNVAATGRGLTLAAIVEV
ncbi:hypothetical protein V8D89_006964 [Ganoderma adspersum]